MDLYQSLSSSFDVPTRIQCIDMHTTGEATRIVLKGFPSLAGTLLEQRQEYRRNLDQYRKTVMLEPRGHEGMYGALLVRTSELIASGEAHMAVLYLHNEGYSTMCGHAAIALGRFLVDTHDLDVFPLRDTLQFDHITLTTAVNLHTPCGVNRLRVPTMPDGRSTDTSRAVSFLSVPSYAGGLDIKVEIPESQRWPQLSEKYVTIDLSYGGAWYCMVDVKELGLSDDLRQMDMKTYDKITSIIKSAILTDSTIIEQILVPRGMSFDLYGVMVVDKLHTASVSGVAGSETGLCFFADQQIDRSPTGGCVAARMALAYAKGERKLLERWAFNSFVSNAYSGRGAFVGMNVEEVKIDKGRGVGSFGVIVQIEGEAYYTGASTFVIESEDPISEGFSLKDLEASQ